MILKVTDPEKVRQLFDGWEETMIWSCLQGIMGSLYAEYPESRNSEGLGFSKNKALRETENPDTPLSAKAMLGDFVFLAGKPSRNLLLYYPEAETFQCENRLKECREAAGFRILVPRSRDWELLIENTYGRTYGRSVERIARYAIKKEPDIWNGEGRKKLESMAAALPEGYELHLIDEKYYDQCRQKEWSRDLVSQFPDYEMYKRWGLGVVACHEKEIVSGASSYSRYLEGIEIEIDTKEEYRRRGLGRACAARLILECLDRRLYPSWDAHTEISAELAEKLGYHRGEAYTAYLLTEEKGLQAE